MSDSTRAVAAALVASTPTVDLVLNHRMSISEGVDPAQICRTCMFGSRRLHMHKPLDVMKYKKSGGNVEDLKCHPDEHAEQRNVYSDGKMRSVNPDGSVPVRIGPKPGPASGKVFSCGQHLQEKCAGCRRLVPTSINVVGGINSNGKEWKRQVVVGGHCSIPADGIIVNGKRVTCDRKPIQREDNIGTCFTCGNCQSFSGIWANEYPTILRTDLTAYEMELARASADPGEVGLAIWAARQKVGTAPWPIAENTELRNDTVLGLMKFFEADVLETVRKPVYRTIAEGEFIRTRGYEARANVGDSAWNLWGRFVWSSREEFLAKYTAEHRGSMTRMDTVSYGTKMIQDPMLEVTGEHISEYKVRFRGSGTIAVFDTSCSDDTVGIVHPSPHPGKVIIQILSPWHRKYGLPDTTKMARRIFPHVECTKCEGKGELTIKLAHSITSEPCFICHGTGKVLDWPKDRVMPTPRAIYPPNPNCMMCDRHHPCSAHARGLQMVESEDGVSYEFPHQKIHDRKPDPDERFRLRFDGEKVVNGAGEVPHVLIFKIQLRSLMQAFPAHKYEILKQYGQLENNLELGRARWVNLGMGSFMGVEAGKPYCTLNMHDPNQGLNLREIFGDWFGDPRSVRVTNALYARSAPMSASDPYFSWEQAMMLEDWQRITNPGERIAEEIVRNEHQLRAHRNGLPGFDRFGNRLEPFMMPQDADVEILPVGDVAPTTSAYVEWLDTEVEVPISEDGATMMVSHRYLRHGYEVKGRTGANKKRKTSAMQADVEIVRFNHDAEASENVDRIMGFLCTAPSCGATYTVDEINDPEDPTCTKVTYFNQETDEVHVCGAPLRWDEQDREWEQGHTKMTGDANPDEPYRRVGSPVLAGGPNSTRWQQNERLLRTGCDSWRPKAWIKRSYQKVASASQHENRKEINYDDWRGRTLSVEVDGEKLTFKIGIDISFEAPLVQAVIRSKGDDVVKYMGGYGPMQAKVLELQ